MGSNAERQNYHSGDQTVEKVTAYFRHLKEIGVDYVEPAVYDKTYENPPTRQADYVEEPPTAEYGDSTLAGMKELAAQVADCKECALHKVRTQTVFGTGKRKSEIIFVGEAPGAEEDRQGKPFVGRSGKLLTKMIESIGFKREEVFIANVLKCRPPENRDPKPEEIEACEHFLITQIKLIRPALICALGAHAARTLLKTKESIGRLRGSFHDYHGVPLLATYHPAFLLRSPAYKKEAWKDLQLLRDEHKKIASAR